jgi:glycosyltransferase involved in cell wall biosynthesis
MRNGAADRIPLIALSKDYTSKTFLLSVKVSEMGNGGRKFLLAVIPQCPLDPASGAARSLRGVCELLAVNGWDVTVTATTGAENGLNFDGETLRRDFGIEAVVTRPDRSPGWKHLTFSYRGLSYRLLDTAGYGINEARVSLAAGMDALVLQAAERRPAVLLTYGSSEEEVRRRASLRAMGTKVVFFLRNFSYFHERSFTEVDAVLTPSQFLSDYYRERSGLHSTPLPLYLPLDEVVAPCREPVFYTFINPCPGKGLDIFLSIVRTAGAKRPDLAFLAVESRGSGELVAERCRSLGIPLDSVNLHIARSVPQPQRIYAVTRVLLVPSIAPDAGPRVIPEAQLNGIPVLASDRCGFAANSDFAGFVLSVQTPGAVDSWFEVICRLHDDVSSYSDASRQAYLAADPHRTGETARAYIDFFQDLAD